MYSVQEIEEMKESGETPLEIHTDETIERFNETLDNEEKNILRLYQDDEDGLYKPIVPCKKKNESDSESQTSKESQTSEESDSSQTSEEYVNNQVIQPPKPKKKGVSMSIHQNDEITMLWSVKGELDFSKKFCSTVIECNVSYGIEKWKMTLKKLVDYMDKERKSPSRKDKNKNIKKLGSWVGHQKENYKNNKQIMTNPEIRKEWKETVDKYKEYLSDNEEVWRLNLKKLVDYMEKEMKSPSQHDKNPAIEKLGSWVSQQKLNYKKNKEIMSNPEIHKEWKETVDKYKEYLGDNEEVWRLNLKKLIDSMEKERQRPNRNTKIGMWVGTQKKNYLKKQCIMTNPEIRKEWKETVDKYKEYLSDNEEKWEKQWRSTLEKLVDYMEKEKKSPNKRDKNPDIKILGAWVSNQKQNYSKNKGVMTNPEIRKEWEETLVKYKKYLNQSVIDISNSEEKQVEILTQLPACKYNEDDKKQLQKTITKKQKDIPKVSKESNESNSSESPPLRSQSEIGKLHRTYHRIKSEKLHQKFKDDPQLWEDYHETRKQNFASYEKESIPTNRIIKELKKIKTKRQKVVVDMGCGKADIAHYFNKKKDNRFLFYNYDHQSGGDEMIQAVNILKLPLEDASVEIAIMSLALWGTKEDKLQYIREAYRVLESGGKFYISDSTKKWSPKELTKENGGEKLRNLLTENGFKIISEEVGDPFCLFVCSKEY
jgi:hypothetical protein